MADTRAEMSLAKRRMRRSLGPGVASGAWATGSRSRAQRRFARFTQPGWHAYRSRGMLPAVPMCPFGPKKLREAEEAQVGVAMLHAVGILGLRGACPECVKRARPDAVSMPNCGNRTRPVAESTQDCGNRAPEVCARSETPHPSPCPIRPSPRRRPASAKPQPGLHLRLRTASWEVALSGSFVLTSC